MRTGVEVRALQEVGGASQRGLLNDFTRALGQQMFYWGRDVMTDGNLLVAAGFEKRRSEGLQGTSCYRLRWRNGFIELHGACAGWYPAQASTGAPGFLFVRTDKRCYAHALSEAVVPGKYEYESLRSGVLSEVMAGARFFARWLISYEAFVVQRRGWRYREDCRAMFAKLESGRMWLEPQRGVDWLRGFAAGDPRLKRAREWA